MSDYQIRCPRCWERPECQAAFYCDDSCSTPFNTFDTKGECPTCGKQHEEAQCKRCKERSAISLWYHHIRCPKCFRPPSTGDRWECDKCGEIWNTFDTRGRCPDCQNQSETTECLICCATAPHLDWYEGHV